MWHKPLTDSVGAADEPVPAQHYAAGFWFVTEASAIQLLYNNAEVSLDATMQNSPSPIVVKSTRGLA